jgi:RNA polymerase sigma-B factor
MTLRWHARADPWPVRAAPCPDDDLSALLSRCAAGDTRARETIILRFLPLARRIARGYDGRGEPLDDLRQAATVGLIKAVDRYSADRGVAFPAYARPMIVGEIRRHFRDTTWTVHVPRALRERAGQVLRAEQDLRVGFGSARPEAVANHLGIGRHELAAARQAIQAYAPRSLDERYGRPDGDGPLLREVIGTAEPGYERVELCAGIRQALLTLKPRDQKVLLLRLAWELPQDEIASRVGLSQMHVSRILRRAGVALTASSGLTMSPRRQRGMVSPDDPRPLRHGSPGRCEIR